MVSSPQKKGKRQSDYSRFYIYFRNDIPLHRQAAEILAIESKHRNMTGFISEAVIAYAEMHNIVVTSDVEGNKENKHRIKSGEEPLKGEAKERRTGKEKENLPPNVSDEQSVVLSSSERKNKDTEVELEADDAFSADNVVIEEGFSGRDTTILEDELDLDFFLKGMESLTF